MMYNSRMKIEGTQEWFDQHAAEYCGEGITLADVKAYAGIELAPGQRLSKIFRNPKEKSNG